MSTCGFVESCTSTATRSRPTFALPDRGPFTFPAPYGTTSIRLTNPEDTGGQDALWPCGYSYWSNVNAHMGEPNLLVFLGVDRQRGGAGPSLWSVDKATVAVTPLGPLFPPEHPLTWATAEGWYWSATDPTFCMRTTSHLYRVHVRTGDHDGDRRWHPVPQYFWQWHPATTAAPTRPRSKSWARPGPTAPSSTASNPSHPCAGAGIRRAGTSTRARSTPAGSGCSSRGRRRPEGEDNRIVLSRRGACCSTARRRRALRQRVRLRGGRRQLPPGRRAPALDVRQGPEPQGRLVYPSPRGRWR